MNLLTSDLTYHHIPSSFIAVQRQVYETNSKHYWIKKKSDPEITSRREYRLTPTWTVLKYPVVLCHLVYGILYPTHLPEQNPAQTNRVPRQSQTQQC